MMEIDIRNQDKEDVISIRFGPHPTDVIHRANSVTIGIAMGDQGRAYIKDIDNLILALQKAKEIWS